MAPLDSKLSHDSERLGEDTHVTIVTSIAAHSRESDFLLKDLATPGNTNPLGMLPMLLKETLAS